MNRIRASLIFAAVFAGGYIAGEREALTPRAEAAPGTVAFAPGAQDMVYELRTYTTHEGRLDALHQRFRDHTMRLFEAHGMTNIGYWVPRDEDLAQNTVVYLLAHPSREAARESWSAFVADSRWQEVSRESQLDGPIVAGLESVFLDPTDYSQLK